MGSTASGDKRPDTVYGSAGTRSRTSTVRHSRILRGLPSEYRCRASFPWLALRSHQRYFAVGASQRWANASSEKIERAARRMPTTGRAEPHRLRPAPLGCAVAGQPSGIRRLFANDLTLPGPVVTTARSPRHGFGCRHAEMLVRPRTLVGVLAVSGSRPKMADVDISDSTNERGALADVDEQPVRLGCDRFQVRSLIFLAPTNDSHPPARSAPDRTRSPNIHHQLAHGVTRCEEPPTRESPVADRCDVNRVDLDCGKRISLRSHRASIHVWVGEFARTTSEPRKSRFFGLRSNHG